jgi:hypothetical protein
MSEPNAKAKIKMKQGLMAVYKCSVKNLRDDDRKIVAIRSDILKGLKKEMDIEILATIKPEGVLWRNHVNQPQVAGDNTHSAAAITALGPDDYTGLTAAQIRSKKMLAGKARKKAEREEAARLLEQKQLNDSAALTPTGVGIIGEIVGESLEAVGKETSVVTGGMSKEEIEEKSMEEFLASQKQ